MLRRMIFTSLLTTTLALGCGGDKTPGATAGGGHADKAPAAAPAFDAAAIEASLQGDWSVQNPKGKPEFLFKIKGDNIEVSDLRFSKPKTQAGKLVIEGAHELGVKLPDGTTYKYAFAKIGDTLHLGMGTVFEADSLDKFELKVSMFEKVIKDAKGCRWTKTFGGKDDSRDVKCAVTEKDGKKILSYQVPDSFEPSKLADKQLYVFGKVLINQELLDSVAHKQ